MGSPLNEVGRDSDEDQHQVVIGKPFYIGIFEVTQKQYELVMGDNPAPYYYRGDSRPAESVSYNMIRGSSAGRGWPSSNTVDAISFLGRIRMRTGLTFDLPTEAQWEYACRAGTTTSINNGRNLVDTVRDVNMDEVGRYCYNAYDGKGGTTYHTTIVGSYMPNNWGLYDMHGNVWEWCLDGYESSLGMREVVDPKGSSSTGGRTLRGGCCGDAAQRCRSASRTPQSSASRNYSYYGFRLCCPAE